MKGRARIVVTRDDRGRSVITRCEGTPPLTPRVTGDAAVHLVATAGGPLPGDTAHLEISVAAGALLVIRASAATVALPGPTLDAPASRWEISATVEPGATLVMLGEPLVAASGCRHETSATVSLHGDARLVWRDLLVPGRHGERAGDARVTLRVTRDSQPLLAQRLAVGDASSGWDGPAVLGDARCVGSLLLAGPAHWQPEVAELAGSGAVLVPLAAAGAALGTAIGAAPDVRRQLDVWLPPLLEAAALSDGDAASARLRSPRHW
jgi:urease accessory protein